MIFNGGSSTLPNVVAGFERCLNRHHDNSNHLECLRCASATLILLEVVANKFDEK